MDRTGTSQSREINSPTRITAGLLGSDRAILAPLLILGAVPGFIEVAQPWLDDRQVFLFAALRQLVAMVVICLIARRWIVRLRREVRPIPVTAFIGATLTGFGLWLLFSIPPLLPLIDPRPEMRFFGVIVAIPAVIVAWRYLLLPVSLLLGIRGTRAQLTFARELTREDPLLPLRILIPPLSIKVTLLALLAAFSPTGRSAFVTSCGPLVSAVVPLLTGYLALGFIVHRLGERRWNELGLDPYRQARTATIIVQGPGWLARALQIGPALVILSLGILVQLGNLARLAGAPVPVDVVVSAVSLSDDQASVTIRITDSSARFRGFTPAAFFLASDTGFAITRRPERATLSGDDRDVRYRFPRDQDHAEVTLVFSTRRPALEMQKLEDIHLWYGGNRLERLVLKDAPIELPAQGSPPPAPSPP